MKPALVIAIGNTLRRDDGIAHHVSGLLTARTDVETRAVLQLTPEMAHEITRYDTVVFMDADVSAEQLLVEPVDAKPSLSGLTHVSRPSEIVALARALFGFSGEAFLCRIPMSDLSEGERLSWRTKRLAVSAARSVLAILAPGRHAKPPAAESPHRKAGRAHPERTA
jgi:Ni,Fe-hydrogenase maturation factor